MWGNKYLCPSVITQLFLFWKAFTWLHSIFLTNRFEQSSPLTWPVTWCTHISIPILGLESHSGIFLSKFSHGEPQASVTPLLTWKRWSNWPHLLPTPPTQSHWEVSSKIGPDTVSFAIKKKSLSYLAHYLYFEDFLLSVSISGKCNLWFW